MKNFLDTQVGGTSENTTGSVGGKSQTTDLSPSQIKQIQYSTEGEEEKIVAKTNEQSGAVESKSVKAVEEGKTSEDIEGISAAQSTASQLLDDYEVEEGEEEESDKPEEEKQVDSIYSNILSSTGLLEEDIDIEDDETENIVPIDKAYYIDEYGDKKNLPQIKGPEQDEDIKESFPIGIDGSPALSISSMDVKDIMRDNSARKEDEMLINLDGLPIDRKLIPESENEVIKTTDENDPRRPNAYYRLKNNSYYKDSDGNWYKLKEHKHTPWGKSEQVVDRKLILVDSRAARALEDNAAYLIDKDQASKNAINLIFDRKAGRKLLKDIGRKDMYGNVIDLSSFLLQRDKEEQAKNEYIYPSKDINEVTAQHYTGFNYDGKITSELQSEITARLVKSGVDPSKVSSASIAEELKPDGEYINGRNRFVKDNGKWYRLTKPNKGLGLIEGGNALITGYRNAKNTIGGGIIAKEIKNDDIIGIEMNSIEATAMSTKYIRWSITSAIEEFEDKALIGLEKVKGLAGEGLNYLFDYSAKKLASDFSQSPVLGILNETLNSVGIKLNKNGFTTDQIEKAELNILSAFGDVLNDTIEERRVQFNLSNENLFSPNPYALDAARQRASRAYISDALGRPNPLSLTPSSLSDSDIIKHKGLVYLNENNTFNLPKKPGVYFTMEEEADATFAGYVSVTRAIKEYNNDGTYSWFDENGDAVTDPIVLGKYESSQVSPGDVSEAYSVADRSIIEGAFYDVEGDFGIVDGNIEIENTNLYKLIFNNHDLSMFLTEKSSPVYGDPYFSAMIRVWASKNADMKASDFISMTTGSSELTSENFDEMSRKQGAFSSNLANALVAYNEYKDSDSSLRFFIENSNKFKNRTSGIDDADFDKAVDQYTIKAFEVLSSNASNSTKVKLANDLKLEIIAWKENLNISNSKLEEIRLSGSTVSRFMMNEKEKTIGTLKNLGNSRQLETGYALYKINKEMFRLIDENAVISSDGETGISNTYTQALDNTLSDLSSQADAMTEQKASSSLNDQSRLNAKLQNLDKGISVLKRLIYSESIDPEDYEFEVPEGFELDESGRDKLVMDLVLLEKTRDKVVNNISSLDIHTNAFFLQNPNKVVKEVVGDVSFDVVKPYISAIPSGDGFSAKNQFDFMFTSMNERRLQLEKELNLEKKTLSSFLETSADRLKDLFSEMSPKEKEYYSLVRQVRVMTPLFMNNQVGLKKEEDGWQRSFMGGLVNFAFPTTGKASGTHLWVDFVDTKDNIRDVNDVIMNMNRQIEGNLHIEEDSQEDFSALLEYGFSEDGWGGDFWGQTMGVTANIITLFTGTGFAYTKLFKGIVGVEKLLIKTKKGKKIADSIIESGARSFYTKYNDLMSKNKVLKHLVGPSLTMGARFKTTGAPFNQDIQEELTFLGGAAGGLLSHGYLKGFPWIGRKVSGMTKEQYANFMKGAFGDKTLEAMRTVSRVSGFGTAEFFQETGEELTRIWQRTKNGEEFWKELDLQFGSSDHALKFAVSTFVMGAAFGIGSKAQMSSAYAALSSKEKVKYDTIVDQYKSTHKSIIAEANKSREETMQRDTDSELAVQETTKTKTEETTSEETTLEEQVSDATTEEKAAEEQVAVEQVAVEQKVKEEGYRNKDGEIVSEEDVVKEVLGEKSPEIIGERTTLTYNADKSQDSGSIVYDINNEGGAIGQVSGSFNSDGDFVIEEIGVDKSSGGLDIDAIDTIAENVKGDIILPGGSSLGASLHKDGLALIDKNGNYLIPNTESSITEDEGKTRAGDSIRGLKRKVSKNGIQMNAGPGSGAFNLAIEAAAKVLDVGGSIVRSVASAKTAFKNSKFYKGMEAQDRADSLTRLEAALREKMTTEELIEYDSRSTKSVNEAVKVWQKNSEIYNSASRSEKTRLTKEFKNDLAEQVDKSQSKKATKEEKESGRDKLSEVKVEITEEIKEEKSKKEKRKSLRDKIDSSKNRISSAKDGMKIIEDIKKEISEYAKENLPNTKYSKADIKRILSIISKVKTHTGLAKAFLEVDGLIAKKGGQDLAIKRKETKSRISYRNLKKQFSQKEGSKRKAKMDYIAAEEVVNYVSQMGGMDAVSEMNMDEISEFNEVLDILISTGKSDFKSAQKFLQDQRRKIQGGIISGFGRLNTSLDVTGSVNNVNDIRSHLDVSGNYIIMNGKYYNKTDFKEFEAENLKEFKDTEEYLAADTDQKKILVEEFRDNLISLKDKAEDVNFSIKEDFQAYQKEEKGSKSKLRERVDKVRSKVNPINAAMSIYELSNLTFGGGVFKGKGNNELKDFMQENIINKMPIAFARTQQQVYEIQQANRAELERIFGKANFRAVTNKGEQFINAIAGGYTSMPRALGNNPGSGAMYSSTTGEEIVSPFKNQNSQKIKPTNDQLINVYNIARSSDIQRDRLIKQGVDVEAIDKYIEANPKLMDYSNYLMDFYNNEGRDMYQGAYQKYTKGSDFEMGKDGKNLYYPISSADATNKEGASQESIMDMISSGNFKGVAMAINPDAFQERTNKGNINIDRTATETFAKYNTQNSRYSNFADITLSVQTLFGNENLVNLMKKNMGEGAYQKFTTALSESISGQMTQRTALGDWGNNAAMYINTIGILGTLWGKPQQILKQATSFSHFWNAGLKHGMQGDLPGWHAGITGVAKRKPFSALYGAMTSEEVRDFEMSVLKSGFVQDRWSGGGSSLDIDLQMALQNKQNSVFDWLTSKPANVALLTTRLGDMAGVLFGPGGGMSFAVNMYNKFKSEGLSHEESTQRAIEIFQVEATQAQQTTQIDNYSTAQKNPLFRLAGQYRTSQASAAKKAIRAVTLLTGRTNLNKKEKAQAVSDMIYFGILSPITFTAVSGGQLALLTSMFAGTMPVSDRDDEDEVRERMKSDWLADTAQSLMQGYAYSGYTADAIMNLIRSKSYYNQLPVFKTLQALYDGIVNTGAVKGDDSKDILELFGASPKNMDQLSDLFDLFQRDKVFTEEFARTMMNWDEVYMDDAFKNYNDKGRDNMFFKQDHFFEVYQGVFNPSEKGKGKGIKLFGVQLTDPGRKSYTGKVRPPIEGSPEILKSNIQKKKIQKKKILKTNIRGIKKNK